MSTRGIIAVSTEADEWIGVYHHDDSFPSDLGVYLLRILDKLDGNVNQFRKLIIDSHKDGWSSLFESDYYSDDGGKFFYHNDYPSSIEYIYIVTPDGLLTYHVPNRMMYYDLKQAIREQDSYSSIREFNQQSSWAFKAPLPKFVRKSKVK